MCKWVCSERTCCWHLSGNSCRRTAMIYMAPTALQRVIRTYKYGSYMHGTRDVRMYLKLNNVEHCGRTQDADLQ